MVAYIIAAGLLVVGLIWYFTRGVSQPGIDQTKAGVWNGVGSLGQEGDRTSLAAERGIADGSGATTGFRPRFGEKVGTQSYPPSIPPSTGPKVQARSGRGAF